MPYDYSKLRGRIVEKCGNQRRFASEVGLSERSVSLKMNGKRYWRQSDISNACKVLDIPEKDIQFYFFATKVQ